MIDDHNAEISIANYKFLYDKHIYYIFSLR